MNRKPNTSEPLLPAPARLWNVREAADFLGVRVSTLYQWSYSGEGGPPVMRIGRALRYDPNQLLAWARSKAA